MSELGNQHSHPQPHDDHDQVVIVMVPFPTQSHLNQLLNLSHRLASYNIPVHYTGSTTLNHQVRFRHHCSTTTTTTTDDLITFHDFDLPTKPKTSTFIEYILPTLDVMRVHVTQLMQQLSPKYKKIILIHDVLMTSVIQDVKTIPNAFTYPFHPFSPFFLFFHYWETTAYVDKPFELENEVDNISKCVPYCDWCPSPQFTEFAVNQVKLSEEFESGKIYNTSRLIEGTYIELMEKLSPTKVKHFAIGPFNPMEVTIKSTQHKCLEWLDKQEKDSVIYVSFGTTTFMSDEQVRELATGLERSGQSFLFALQRPDLAHGGANHLLEGLRLEEGSGSCKRGFVVREWTPQLEILAHPATGGFMTHCGWGSCIESITMGVPVAAWPNQSDQPKNAVLLSNVLKMGLFVRDWSNRGEIVTSIMVADVVTRLMASEEGDQMRKRAKELSKSLRESLASGVSEFDYFVDHISK